jgi:hypothetical protein
MLNTTRMSRYLFVTLLCWPLWCQPANKDQPLSRLTIEVVNHLGVDFAAADIGQISVKTSDGRYDVSNRVKGLVATGIPYGDYIVLVWVKGFNNPGRRQVRVRSPETFVKVGTRWPFEFEAGLRTSGIQPLKGTLQPPPSQSDRWWIRIDGLYLDYRLDVPMASDGKFSVENLDQGSFLVSVFDGSILKIAKAINIHDGWIDELSVAGAGDLKLVLDNCDGCK